MPATRNPNLWNIPDQSFGTQIGAYGFPASVVNKDSLTAQSDPDDPYEVLDGTDTYHANVVPIQTFGAAYLGLVHMWFSSTYTATATADPIVRVFGHVPNPRQAKPRLWPQDVSSSFYDLTDTDIAAEYRGLWVPLTPPGYTLGTPTLTLSGTPIDHVIGTTSREVTSELQYVFLAGCDYALVTVSTAATLSAGATKKGVIVGTLFG